MNDNVCQIVSDDEEVLNEAEPQPSTSSTPLHGPGTCLNEYQPIVLSRLIWG